MAFETKFLPDADRFETNLSGTILPPDILRMDEEIIESPHWHQGVSRLVEVGPDTDLSAFTLDVLTQDLLPHLHERRTRHPRKQRIAWVVPSDFHRTMVQVWEMMPATQELESFRVFTTRRLALDWLAETANA